jgi:SAM-dependent methyltransferase
VAGHEQFDSVRCIPFQLDISKAVSETDAWPLPFEKGSLGYVLLIFVLSALDPQRLQCAVENVFRFLKPGGRVFFRDYGRYDMAQLRFKPGKCISDNFYKRGDGTRCYFFTQEEVLDLFRSVGFVEEQLKEDKRLQVNRGKQLKMYRIWIQAKFKKPEKT